MATSAQLNGSSPLADHRLAPQAAALLAHANEIMMEQLQYLADLGYEHGICNCSACQRYLRVRSALLEIFAEPSANAPPRASLSRESGLVRPAPGFPSRNLRNH